MPNKLPLKAGCNSSNFLILMLILGTFVPDSPTEPGMSALTHNTECDGYWQTDETWSPWSLKDRPVVNWKSYGHTQETHCSERNWNLSIKAFNRQWLGRKSQKQCWCTVKRSACSLDDSDGSDVQAVKMSRFLQMEVEEPVRHSLIKTLCLRKGSLWKISDIHKSRTNSINSHVCTTSFNS